MGSREDHSVFPGSLVDSKITSRRKIVRKTNVYIEQVQAKKILIKSSFFYHSDTLKMLLDNINWYTFC